MRAHRDVVLAVVLAAAFAAARADAQTLASHSVVLDRGRELLSWVTPQARAYDAVVTLSWRSLETMPPQPATGLPAYYTNPVFDPETGGPGDHPFLNAAGLNAMLADGALRWYAYSGDRAALELVRGLLDHQLAHGTTPDGWVWPRVPYASADAGALEYRGGDDVAFCGGCGAGDGRGVIEPDKVGELGFAYLSFHQLGGEPRYLDAAIACADALARNVRPGDAARSPWPFRVHGETGEVREEYTANVLGPVRLFDELIRLGRGDVAAYASARDAAWSWLMAVPMQNGLWSGYFEDMPIQPVLVENVNQYIPLETARYVLAHPERDPDWRAHVPALIAWVEDRFGRDAWGSAGTQWGATAISEQWGDLYKMGSHTARYASVAARWSAVSGDRAAREKAFRSFNWATYMCDEQGRVRVGDVDGTYWFTDGYADYARHFLSGMAAVPGWAPPGEDHLLGSSSIVQQVAYGTAEIRYRTFDEDAIEVLRLRGIPETIVAGTTTLRQRRDLAGEGYTVEALGDGDYAVRIRHRDRDVTIGPRRAEHTSCGCGSSSGGASIVLGAALIAVPRRRRAPGGDRRRARGSPR